MNYSVSFLTLVPSYKNPRLVCLPIKEILPIGLFLSRCSSFLVYFPRSPRLHCLSLMETYQLPHWCTEWILLLVGTYELLPLCLSMWLICCHLQFIILLLILEILHLYRYQYNCYQINLILGRLHVYPHPCLLPQQYLQQFILQYRLQGFFITFFVFISCHVVQNGYSWFPIKHWIFVTGVLFLNFF